MSVTISTTEYQKFLKMEARLEMLENRQDELREQIRNLYTLESNESNGILGRYNVHVVIDKVNLMGLLGISLPQDEIHNVIFEFKDRSIFLSERPNRGF